MRGRWACGSLVALSALPGGCSGVQSTLAPMGPDAARIWQLGALMVVGAAVVLLIVCAATWIAMRGSDGARRALAGSGAIVAGGIAFPAVTLTALLTYGIWVMRANIAPAATPPQLRVEVSGEMWWWRIAYIDWRGHRIADANEIRIPVGREIELILTSPDVIHSFWVPNLSGKLDMIPGRTNTLRLKADQPGVYRGQCAEYCGGAHARMALEVVAMPEAEFDTWFASAAETPAAEPADATAERGRALFLAAGCGACHAVRGTPATGTIGPDLTRVGARRFIAAASMPTTPDHLAQFIENSQHLKPGNLMPPFRIFKPDELSAIALYLASLK
jgi:cytochrome c oxidase subunit II